MHGARSGSESMKLGICSMWGPSPQSFREEVKLAPDLGYDLVTIGDSPAGWHELYVSMTLAALDAPTATTAPLVTSSILRHPPVTANALCSIVDLSGCRVDLGLANGGSPLMAIGRPHSTQQKNPQQFAALEAVF